MKTKTCTTCKFEPDWVFYDAKQGHSFACHAGKCKFPLPQTLTPFIGRDSYSRHLKDHGGKYFVDMVNGAVCYAWEAKE